MATLKTEKSFVSLLNIWILWLKWKIVVFKKKNMVSPLRELNAFLHVLFCLLSSAPYLLLLYTHMIETDPLVDLWRRVSYPHVFLNIVRWPYSEDKLQETVCTNMMYTIIITIKHILIIIHNITDIKLAVHASQ